jgi:hypothetical protein
MDKKRGKRKRRNQKHGVDTYKKKRIYLSFGKTAQLKVPGK